MTGTGGPELSVDPLAQCSAGATATIQVQVWHHGPRPAEITVAVRGLDAEWTPEPVSVGILPPGQVATVPLSLRPGPSAIGARYPFVVVAAATDSFDRGEPAVATFESTLVVGGRERAVLDLDPPQATAVFGRRIRLTITNPSVTDRDLLLEPTVPQGLSVTLPTEPISVGAGRTVTVRGRVSVRRSRVFGTVQTHSYAIAARGQGAPVIVNGTLQARPVFRGALVRALVLTLVIALWVGLAVVALPRVSSYFTADQKTVTSTTPPTSGSDSGTSPSGGDQSGAAGGTDQGGSGGDQGGGGSAGDQGTGDQGTDGGGAAGGDSGGGSGNGSDGHSGSGSASGSDSGSGSDGGSGSGGTGGDGEPTAPPSSTPSQVTLQGLVTGADPGGVTVVLGPTSMVEAAGQGAEPAPGTDEQTASGLRAARGAIGKVWATSLRVNRAEDPPSLTTTTNDDGTFALAGIRPQGYYLLTVARAGFRTQRFIINGANLVGADPMKIALIAGDGAMSGTVAGPDGPIGAATVTITDGHVSVQTASVSPGAEGTPGSWSVTGLSTPGTYLVSAAAPGFGTSSALVTLGAGGTANTDLTLVTGAAQVTGTVTGQNELGQLGGLGGMSVSITGQSGDVTTTRTSTTATTGPVGQYVLPDLPTPGEYTVTVSGDGYQDQVQHVSLAEGVGSAVVDVAMVRVDGAVSGTVFGNPATGDKPAEGGLIGAGLTLTGPQGSTKTMSTSDPAGSFRFTGVKPGVYVLSGSMFGRLPSSVTVEVTAAGEATADLTLLSSASTELPATARIQGRVVDSRTGGQLTCDRAEDPATPCVITASVSVPAIDPATGQIDPNLPPTTVSATANPAENYLLPALDDPDHPGLVPGLYTVTITAPGYEPGSVQVQVPQGAVMSAAPVSLIPLSLISGRLTTRVGTPVAPTCVGVVAAGVVPPTRADGCVAAADGRTCTIGTDPKVRCGLVQVDGTYQVRGLTHGGYTVVVIPTDPEYIAPAPFDLTIDLGSDGRYDPLLDRLGRIAVTVRQPDLATAALGPAAGATVAAVLGSTSTSAPPTDADGTTTVIALTPGTYRVDASGDAGTASTDNVFVQLNQTIDVNLVLIKPLGTVVGRVVTNDGVSPQPVSVPAAPVTITGVIGYTGLAPVFGAVTLTTDINGCFAVLPTSTTPKPGGFGPCPQGISADSAAAAISGGFLVARPISVAIGTTDQSQASYQAQVGIVGDGQIRTIPVDATTVQPKPSSTANLTLGTLPAGTARGLANLTVLTKSPLSGQVAAVDLQNPAGGLRWSDSAVTGDNLLSPGRYSVQAAAPGFTSLPARGAQILCGLGTACTYVVDPTDATSVLDPALRLVRNPTFTGSVTVLPTGAGITGATFSVSPLNSNLPPISLTASGTTLSWQEQGAPANLVTPGSYSVTASLAGFESDPVTFTCAPPTTGAETCPLALTLRQLSSPTITVVSNVAVGSPNRKVPAGATITITGTSIGTRGPFTDNNTGDGIQIALPPLSSLDKSYQMTVRAPGFAPATFTSTTTGNISCAGGSGLFFQPGPTACTVTLTQLAQVTVTTVQAGSLARLSGVGVKVTQLTGTGADSTWDGITVGGSVVITGSVASPGLTPGETYRVSASLIGYDDASTDVTIPAGTLDQPVTIALRLRPVTLQVALVAGTGTSLPNGTLTVTGRDFSGTAVNRTCMFTTQNTGACTPTQTDTTLSGIDVLFAKLLPGGYQLAFTSTDGLYRPLTQSVQVAGGTDPVPVTMTLAAGTSAQTGTVLAPDGSPLSGATVTLRQNNNVEVVAKDVAGTNLPEITTGSDGAFSFRNVPDGVYRVMVDACGYGRTFSAAITLNTSVTANPPAVSVRLARVTRAVTVNVSSTAGTSLVGLPASFQPVALDSGDPACTMPSGATNTALTGFFVAPDGTVTAPQLPTGRWVVAVSTPNSPFGASTPSFLSPMPDYGTPTLNPTIPPINVIGTGGQIRQAQISLSVTWPAGCATPPSSVRLTITPATGDPATLDATVQSGTDKSGTASLTTLLPAGSYSWSLAADNNFTAQPATGSLTVPSSGSTPAQSISSTLQAPAVPVNATLSVNGGTSGPAGVVRATPAGGGSTVTSDGSGLLCLAPTAGWTVSIRSTTDPTMLIPDITGVSVTRAGPNTVAFVGYGLQPGVSLATVDRRTPDTTARSVPLTVTGPGTSWSGTATIAAGASAGTGPTLTLGAGSYTLAAAASAPFGTASQSGIDPATTQTATLTLPYTAVTLAVTASGAPDPGATFTLTPAAGGSPITTTTAAAAVFRDIAPGTYTIAASKTVGTVTYSGQLTDQVLGAGTTPQLNVPMTAPPPPNPPN